MADSIACPLGKLVDDSTSRRWGTTVGRGRRKTFFMAMFATSPLAAVSSTTSAVR